MSGVIDPLYLAQHCDSDNGQMDDRIDIHNILKCHSFQIKGGEANFSFRDFKPDFLHQYLLKS